MFDQTKTQILFFVYAILCFIRDAARCGVPQLRLAAAIGHRVGRATGELEVSDALDLIGAAGRLGGRLHLATRALADRLEPEVHSLPPRALLRLARYLGALEMLRMLWCFLLWSKTHS